MRFGVATMAARGTYSRSIGNALLKKKNFDKRLAKCSQSVLDLYIYIAR